MSKWEILGPREMYKMQWSKNAHTYTNTRSHARAHHVYIQKSTHLLYFHSLVSNSFRRIEAENEQNNDNNNKLLFRREAKAQHNVCIVIFGMMLALPKNGWCSFNWNNKMVKSKRNQWNAWKASLWKMVFACNTAMSHNEHFN